MPKLLLKFNAAVIQEISLDGKSSLAVGRKPDNDVVIDNPAVSGHHCKITLEGGKFFVEDLDSTNGTYVNQKRVKKSGLRHNDQVGIAKHLLVFIDDSPVEEHAPPADATMVIPAQKQQEILASASAAAAKEDAGAKTGMLRVLKGVVGSVNEFELKGMSTYIGKSDRVHIQIKGAGLFGSAPEVAASIHRRPEGYILMAVEDGYPLVNGAKVSGSVVLKDGDLIDCGGTTMQFILR